MRDAPKRPEREGARLKNALKKAMRIASAVGSDALVAVESSDGSYNIKRFSWRSNKLADTTHKSVSRELVEQRITEEKINARHIPVFLSVASTGGKRCLKHVWDDLSPNLIKGRDGIYTPTIEVEY